MILDILKALLTANLAGAGAILAVLALRGAVRRRFGAAAAYALWLAPLAAAAAALLPHHGAETLISPIVLTAAGMADDFVAQARPSAGPDLAAALLAVWLAGVAAAVGLLARRQAAFTASMGRLEPVAGVFRAEHAGVGPALVGVLRPKVVTPADFETRFDLAERELILAHEGIHLRRGDAAANALSSALQCLCWFNPLVGLGVRMLRIDQELACDAAVIGRFPAARRLYAELLLKTQLATQPLPLGCHWPAGAEHPLRERIVMLKSPLPGRALHRLGLAVAVGVGVGSAGLAWAVQPGQRAPRAEPTLVTYPEWIRKPDGADLARAYPASAKYQGIDGLVTLACRFDAQGSLRRCAVADEAPLEQGFGQAALKLTSAFQAKPTGRDGVAAAGGKVRIPIRFLAPRPGLLGAAPTVLQPVWIRKPNAADIARLYPAGAAQRRLSGRVTMTCRIGADGRLTECGIGRVDVVTDWPATPEDDPDFGTATLQLAKLFQMEPVGRDGTKVAGGVVRIPVRWSPAQ